MNPKSSQCRKAADALQRDIDRKHESARNMRALPPTRKRTQDSQGIFNDAVRLEKYQRLLRLLADQHDAGAVDPAVQAVTSRAAVEREVWKANPKLRAMFDALDRPETAAERNERMERQFQLIGIPGFFATPSVTADKLVQFVGGIQTGEEILEPGAGTGALIDAALRVQQDISVHCFECHYSLSEFLDTKYAGNPVVYRAGGDFNEFAIDHYAPRYDLVLMNPPFESGQDAETVQRAFQLLKPGGRLGAIVGEGIFFRNDKKAVAFREFLEEFDAYDERLPEGAFKSSGTETNCRMIRVRRPVETVQDVPAVSEVQQGSLFPEAEYA